MSSENQPQPTAADYALEDLANQLRAALMEKAVLKGEYIVDRRRMAALIEENQSLRAKLESLDAGDQTQ